MNYSYNAPVELISGDDCVKNYKGYSRFGKKCAVITGRNMHKRNSALSDVLEGLKNAGVDTLVLAEAENNPSVDSVFKLSEKVKTFGAEFIVGIGGGSSMDTAKAVALVTSNVGSTPENIFTYLFTNEPLPSILVGTTAGTGSEVMPSAVLTIDGEIPIKKSLKTRSSYAKVALCDSRYTCSMPDNITVSTALDSICHAMEAIYSKKGGEWAKIYGHAVLKTVIKPLFSFVDGERSDELREKLYFGSLLAGLAINDGGTSFPHSMGYMLTTMHGAPHGFACAVFIGQFAERVSRITDFSETLAACGFSSVDMLKTKLNYVIDRYYKKPVISDTEAEKYAAIAMTMSVNNNYLALTQSDCAEIYKEMSGRGAK